MNLRHVDLRLVVMVALTLGGSARAQVAVFTSVPPGDARASTIADTILQDARSSWRLLEPLPAEEVNQCSPGDTACLLPLAQRHGASHALLVGVAPVGTTGHVVSVRVLEVGNSAPVLEESVVQPVAEEPAGALAVTRALGEKLKGLPGLPLLAGTGLPGEGGNVGTIVGAALLGTGAVVAVTGGVMLALALGAKESLSSVEDNGDAFAPARIDPKGKSWAGYDRPVANRRPSASAQVAMRSDLDSRVSDANRNVSGAVAVLVTGGVLAAVGLTTAMFFPQEDDPNDSSIVSK